MRKPYTVWEVNFVMVAVDSEFLLNEPPRRFDTLEQARAFAEEYEIEFDALSEVYAVNIE